MFHLNLTTYEVLTLYKLIDTVVLIHINYEGKPEEGIFSYALCFDYKQNFNLTKKSRRKKEVHV